MGAALAWALALAVVSAAPAMSVSQSSPGWDDGDSPTPPPAVVSPVAVGGGLEVVVTQDGSTSSGRELTSTSTVRVPPACWYGRGLTGAQYFETWRPGGLVEQGGWSPSADQYVDPTLHAGYEAYAAVEGHWFEATCRADAPLEYRQRYYASHPGLFVEPSDPVPAQEVEVDPAVLAQVARDAMDLPEGTIRWNPSLVGSGATVVGMDTWVWVEDAPTAVRVRAEIPGTWAQVDAVLAGMEVSAPGADPVRCEDTGTPWAEGASGTTCAITFLRSTAGERVEDGQSLPTVTLSATATWAASWTSSLDATATPLTNQIVVTTAQIAVAEIQALVTRD
ncbi:hypothetical protein [Cellulomonas terrae]|uniref:Uncharacterized protein n=1 Tax=Cellulomonas terrae TaxID=311234 RepID=A0A511JRL5_9CELL|nr:hypothetical protein [Cellulomonas terrae]GEM00144.1 hypothetical protein CTE05_36900 [Cellulomonas terrae]